MTKKHKKTNEVGQEIPRKRRLDNPTRRAPELIWEHKEVILQVYPELEAKWAEIEQILVPGCTSCTKNKQKRALSRALQALPQEGRNFALLEPFLPELYLKKLQGHHKQKRQALPLPAPSPAGVSSVREPCVDCFCKHIAQAIILINESFMGYPDHKWLAVAHLQEAAEEIIGLYPKIATDVLQEQKMVQLDPSYIPDLMHFFSEVEPAKKPAK